MLDETKVQKGQRLMGGKGEKGFGDDGSEAGASHYPHDAAVERELEQDWADGLGRSVEGAHVTDRPSVKDEAEDQSEENHPVDIEGKTARS